MILPELSSTDKSGDIKLPEFLYGDSSRLKQVLIMLVKMALKGVLDTRLSIATRYEADSQLLYVEIDDPLGHIYSQMSRVINQGDSESLKALSTSTEIEPMILKGIIEKNGGEIQIQKPSRNSEGYSVTFTMRMHTLDNALDSQGEVIVDFDA